MLVELRIKNFKNIKELVLDLRYSLGRAPGGYQESALISFHEARDSVRTRCVPLLGIFGPNGAGKTSILQAADCLKQIVVSRFLPSFYIPNRQEGNLQTRKPTELGLSFINRSQFFDYFVNYDADGILSEELKVNGRILFSVQNEKVREISETLAGSKEAIQKIFSMRCVRKKFKSQERSLLWCIHEEFPGAPEEFDLAFDFFANALQVFSSGEFSLVWALELLTDWYEGRSVEEKKQKLIFQLSSLLKKLDTTIETFDFCIKPVTNLLEITQEAQEQVRIYPSEGKSKQLQVKTYHRTESGRRISFDLFCEESRGTQRIFALTVLFLLAASTGQTVMIDSLDRNLHPFVQMTLLDFFKDKKYNFTNAQLIFTSHSTDFLEDNGLRLTEVVLVDPRGFQGSQTIRLSEIKGLRNANNFRRRYINGDFGGIPFPLV